MRLLGGNDEDDALVGGVLDLDGSLMVVECVELGKVRSGDREGGVGCGIDVSKSSERSRVENVRFASSATRFELVASQRFVQLLLTFLKMKLPMRWTSLYLGRCTKGQFVVKKAEACL